MEKLLEILLPILYIFISAFNTSYIIHIFSHILTKNKPTKKQLLISTVILLLFCTISNTILLYFPELKNFMPIIGSIGCIIVSFVVYKNNVVQTLLAVLAYIFFAFIVDVIFALLLLLMNKTPEFINSNKIYYYILAIVGNISYLSVAHIIYNIYTKKKLINIFKDNYKYIIYQAISIIVCLIPSMYMMFSNLYNYSAIFLIINAFQLVIVSVFSITYLRKRISFKDTELELENTKLHNTALATINENIRGFKHDMGNMVQSINGYLAVGNIDGVKNYCQNLLHGFNDINLLSILSPKIINDPAIYGIVVSKMLIARENNLTLSLDIGLDVSKINFPSFELSRVLGILLDNAIEASLESDERKLKLEMYHDEKRKCDVIIIGNSVKDANKIDIIKMFEKDYSTKENPSGFGLYEVLKFFNKNNNGDIVPNIDYDENFFTQTVTFDK